MARSRPYEESLHDALRDPDEIAAYLNAALEDGDQALFMLALRHVIEANGGIGLAAKAGSFSRPSMYRMLSEEGNPKLDSLTTLLHSLGMKLSVEREHRAA